MNKTIYEYKVKDGDKTREFALKRPTRREMEDADTQYAVEMSKCVRKGILTKSMLAKKYADSGGVLSEEGAKQLSALYHKLNDIISEQSKLQTVKAQTKKNKERAEVLEKEMVDVRKEIVEIESQNLSLFNNTAEARAQNKILIWYATHLLVEKKGEEETPFFDGFDFEDKLEQYYDREDSEDNEVYVDIMQRAGTVLAFWYYNQGLPKDKFEIALKEFLDEHGEKADKDTEEVKADE